jgi:predicted acetyltransferase
MIDQTMNLIEPDLQYKNAYYRYCESFRAAGEPARALEELAFKNFPAFIKRLKDYSMGSGFTVGFVRVNAYWLARADQTIVGNSNLRHRLTPSLEDLGGHIGYTISPLERHKGNGTLLLQLTLEKAKEMGLEKVLITCDADNTASAGVIINNGGVLASQSVSIQTGKLTSRYWIELNKKPQT